MIKMRYDASGTAVSDWEVNTVVAQLIKEHPKGEVVYSTENIFWQMYLTFMLGNIKSNEIVFLYNNDKIKLSRDKKTRESFPDGFINLNSNQKRALYQYLI